LEKKFSTKNVDKNEKIGRFLTGNVEKKSQRIAVKSGFPPLWKKPL
jgi:hypothetical protein